MKIPVFVSCPTDLNDAQNTSRDMIVEELERLELEPRTLGKTDYPTEFPLREVYLLAKHCSGGVVLGFEQCLVTSGAWKRGTMKEETITKHVGFPTAWNQLEAGILFSLQVPLLVFKEDHISGGVFDHGVTDVFIHKMPHSSMKVEEKKAVSAVFLKWQTSVRDHYYQ